MLYGWIILTPKNWQFKQFRCSKTGRKVALPRLWGQRQSKSCAQGKPPGLNHLCQHLHICPCWTQGRRSTWGTFMVDKPLLKPRKPSGALTWSGAVALWDIQAGVEAQSECQWMGPCLPFAGRGPASTQPCPAGPALAEHVAGSPPASTTPRTWRARAQTRAVPPSTSSAFAAGSVPDM